MDALSELSTKSPLQPIEVCKSNFETPCIYYFEPITNAIEVYPSVFAILSTHNIFLFPFETNNEVYYH